MTDNFLEEGYPQFPLPDREHEHYDGSPVADCLLDADDCSLMPWDADYEAQKDFYRAIAKDD